MYRYTNVIQSKTTIIQRLANNYSSKKSKTTIIQRLANNYSSKKSKTTIIQGLANYVIVYVLFSFA